MTAATVRPPQSRSLRLGLTGGIGSGKSAAADMFAALKVPVIDADQVARAVVEPGEPALAQILAHFGDRVRQPDGSLDRGALRQIIFSQPDAKQWLEALLHPLIRARIEADLAAARAPYVLLVSPLLLESGQDQLVERIIVVDVDEQTQLERASRRDGVDREQIRRIIHSQMPRQERLARAHYRLDNSGDLDELRQQVARLHRELLEKAHSPG